MICLILGFALVVAISGQSGRHERIPGGLASVIPRPRGFVVRGSWTECLAKVGGGVGVNGEWKSRPEKYTYTLII